MSYEDDPEENYYDDFGDEEEISEEVKDDDLLYNILVYTPERTKYENSESKNNGNSESKNNGNSKSKNNGNSKSKNTSNSKSKKNQKSKSPTKNEKSKSPNKNDSKNNKKTTIKKPFIISENKSSPYNKIKVTINACSFFDEYMMPIWCPKDVYIKFRVEGKWRIDKLYDFTDSKGIPSSHSRGYNYGALIGRIGSEQKFVVADESCILVKKEGPLFLRPNLPKKMKIAPEGKLEVSIYDGKYMEIEEINKNIGWTESGTTDYSGENAKNIGEKKKTSKNIEAEEQDLEKKLNKQLNNLRMNPCMFYEKYYSTKLINTKEFLKKYDKIEQEKERERIEKEKGKGKSKEKSKSKGKVKKKEEDIEIMPLEENNDCYDFLVNYFKLPNQITLKKTLNKNNINVNLSKLDDDIGFYLYDEIKTTVKVKCKITQLDNQNEIIFQYLLDKKFREYIFSGHSQSFTIKVFKNFFAESTLVILVIALDKDYFLEDKAEK